MPRLLLAGPGDAAGPATLVNLRPALVNPSVPAASNCNGNGISDFCEVDCNDNGIPDECDIADGTSEDCNENDVPDECDLANGTSEDCNENDVPDECDIANGTSEDCNLNEIPDECDTAPEYDPTTAIAQDDCGDAEYIGPGMLYLDDTFGSTSDGPIFCGLFYGVYDVWYRYRPAYTGIAFASTFGPGTNPLISIHDDCPATTGSMLGCDRAHFGIAFYVERAETYWIRVAGGMFTQGPFQLNLVGPPALLNLDDMNLNGIPDVCECLTDVNDDGIVDVSDFIAVTLAVGGPCDGCPEDVDGSGAVDQVDQQLVIIDQGYMCPFGTAVSVTGGPDPNGAGAID